ncbi:MAG TPA: hypothetical protein VLH79_04055 [Chthonomonadales bacterium]|nr:hypothetical protein [Chthonomonadales bacterium]
MEEPVAVERRGSIAGGAVVASVLSVLLCWLPVIGLIAAGYVGGRRSGGGPARALGAAAVPAALWAGFIWWRGGSPVVVNEQEITLAAVRWAIPAFVGCLLGGALLASGTSVSRLLGGLVAAGGVLWTSAQFGDAWRSVAPLLQRQEYQAAMNQECPQRLTQLGIALRLYAGSWDGYLPPADRWMTAIRDRVREDEWLHCPDASRVDPSAHGYAMNSALSSVRLDSVENKASTPLLYDSTATVVDAHDAVTSLPRPGRHMGRNNVLMADGEVRSEVPR